MSFFAQTGPTAEARLSQQLGQALGQGMSKSMQDRQLGEQQSILARLLYGDQGNQLASLTPDQQLGAANVIGKRQEFLQKTQEQERKNALLRSLLPELSNEQQEEAFTDGGNQPTPREAKELSEEQLIALTMLDPNLAKLKQGQQEQKKKEFFTERDFHTKYTDPIVKEADEIIRQNPVKKSLIDQQRLNIASGKTSGIIPFLVDAMNIEPYRGAEASSFRTIAKNRFIENLGNIGGGARPNQFLEKQLAAGQEAIGRPEEANQVVLDVEEFIEDMREKRAQTIKEVERDQVKQFGYARRDMLDEVDKRMGSYAKDRQEKMSLDIRKRKEGTLSDEDMIKEIVTKKIVPGTPLTPRMANLLMIKNHDDPYKAQAEAKRLGFTIPQTEKP
jgi:hypothetical protein